MKINGFSLAPVLSYSHGFATNVTLLLPLAEYSRTLALQVCSQVRFVAVELILVLRRLQDTPPFLVLFTLAGFTRSD
jgi:hypothetical protein